MTLIFLMKFVQQNVNVTLCPKQNNRNGFSIPVKLSNLHVTPTYEALSQAGGNGNREVMAQPAKEPTV